MKRGKVGRPLGYKLSDASKMAISQSKKGQRHKIETRDKISRSLLVYFNRRSPLSKEFSDRYCDGDDSIESWIDDVRDDLDCSDDIMTSRTMNNKRKMELVSGSSIELISHEMTPELLLLTKEHCELSGIDFYDALEAMLED